MSEKIITEENKHHDKDEAELRRLESRTETNADGDETQIVEVTEFEKKKHNFPAWIIALSIIGLIGLLALFWISSKQSASKDTEVTVNAEKKDEHGDESGHKEGEEGREVILEPESLASANIEIEGVTSRPAIALLRTTGTIEANPQQTNAVSPLVGGRVENVNVGVGDYVSRGQVLAVIASPQIAQMHGKMHEAETALGIAERNYTRVQKAENRVAVLQAKARLDEADATLKRTKRLIELGAGAGKDLTAAETSYKTAKAEYDFQSNISLNKEIQESRAQVETARVDLRHIRDEMRSLGVEIKEHNADDHRGDTSLIPVRAPAAGMVTERPVNAGAGIEAGKTLFVLSNFSSVFAVASVPESQMTLLRVGTVAEINSPALGEGSINARVAYIDPQLNEDTRTGRVRLELPNPNNRLRAGMFVEIGFQTGTSAATGEELVVKSEAVQREGGKTIVFIPKDDEPGAFEVREVETGGEIEGYTRIKSGLQIGEKVITKGSFTLKTQLQKGAMGDDH
ncbi:MAG: efflux RND transporter periplasmic adaptor subunit [Acidobacteriota bacterium]|nr:efflux RND transporter periplasmic adaptor subunit [Acidobacteriota bacterium]